MLEKLDEKPKRKQKQKNDRRSLIPLLLTLVATFIIGLIATMLLFLQPAKTTITQSIIVEEDTNLLSNGSFDDYNPLEDSIWQIEERGTDLEVVWSDANSNSDAYALKLSATEGSNQGWPGLFATVSIDSQLDYIFSAYAFSPDGASGWLSIELLDAERNFVTGYSTGCSEAQEGWHTLTRELKAEWHQDRQISAIRLGLQQCMNFSAGQATTLYFDDVSLIALEPQSNQQK